MRLFILGVSFLLASSGLATPTQLDQIQAEINETVKDQANAKAEANAKAKADAQAQAKATAEVELLSRKCGEWRKSLQYQNDIEEPLLSIRGEAEGLARKCLEILYCDENFGILAKSQNHFSEWSKSNLCPDLGVRSYGPPVVFPSARRPAPPFVP